MAKTVCKFLTDGSWVFGVSAIDFWFFKVTVQDWGLPECLRGDKRLMNTVFSACVRRAHCENVVGLGQLDVFVVRVIFPASQSTPGPIVRGSNGWEIVVLISNR